MSRFSLCRWCAPTAPCIRCAHIFGDVRYFPLRFYAFVAILLFMSRIFEWINKAEKENTNGNTRHSALDPAVERDFFLRFSLSRVFCVKSESGFVFSCWLDSFSFPKFNSFVSVTPSLFLAHFSFWWHILLFAQMRRQFFSSHLVVVFGAHAKSPSLSMSTLVQNPRRILVVVVVIPLLNNISTTMWDFFSDTFLLSAPFVSSTQMS